MSTRSALTNDIQVGLHHGGVLWMKTRECQYQTSLGTLGATGRIIRSVSPRIQIRAANADKTTATIPNPGTVLEGSSTGAGTAGGVPFPTVIVPRMSIDT